MLEEQSLIVCNSNVYSFCLASLAALCHEPNLGNPGVRLSVRTFVRGGGDSVQPRGRGLTRPSVVPRAGPKMTVRSWRHHLRDLCTSSTFQQRCRAGAAASLSRDSRVPRPNADVAAGTGCPTSEVWGRSSSAITITAAPVRSARCPGTPGRAAGGTCCFATSLPEPVAVSVFTGWFAACLWGCFYLFISVWFLFCVCLLRSSLDPSKGHTCEGKGTFRCGKET